MVCGLHTTSSNKRMEIKIKKKLTTWHVGCSPHCQTKGRKKEIDDTACGLHTALSNKRKENKIKKELTTQHMGCTLCHQTKGRKIK